VAESAVYDCLDGGVVGVARGQTVLSGRGSTRAIRGAAVVPRSSWSRSARLADVTTRRATPAARAYT